MKVKYEFEIDQKEYHKVLCEGCKFCDNDGNYVYCELSEESKAIEWDSEKSCIDGMSYLESKCPLEVVE